MRVVVLSGQDRIAHRSKRGIDSGGIKWMITVGKRSDIDSFYVLSTVVRMCRNTKTKLTFFWLFGGFGVR